VPPLLFDNIIAAGLEIFAFHLYDPDRINLEDLLVDIVLFAREARNREASIVINCVKNFILNDVVIYGDPSCSSPRAPSGKV
jgi:hypothetical protein